jgi:LysM repeat protein
MLKTRLVHCILWLSLLFPQVALAQTQEIKEYTVTKGDTLWSISAKELIDPFLWPKIWKENPEIKNPDRLYPGQKINIPIYLIQKEVKEEPPKPVVKEEPPKEVPTKAEKPVMEKPVAEASIPPLLEKSLLVSSGYISSSIPSLGKIIGSPSERNLFGNNDIVYVKPNSPVEIGDKFYVIRIGELVKNPLTGDKIGYISTIVGVAEISKFEYGETEATIAETFHDIATGDLLDTYYDIDPPLIKKPYRKPDIAGVVVGTKDQRRANTNYDVVYINKGLKNGIEVGDMFRTLAVGEHRVPNGIIQIILSQDNSSTAIVRESTMPVQRGNLFVPFEDED